MNLLLRIISSLILLPLVLYAFYVGGVALFLLLAVAFVLGTFEYAQMLFPHNKQKYWIAIFAVILATCYACENASMHIYLLVWASMLGLGAYFVFQPQLDARQWEKYCALFFVFPYLGGALFALDAIREGQPGELGLNFVLLIFVVTWSNDICAYFGGKTFGRHKLYERVSAQKTWEGFVAGSLGCIIIPAAFYLIAIQFQFSTFSMLTWADLIWVSLPAIALAPLGDLLESRIKRLYAVKDSGKLLPGHGGVLDRIDAVLVVAPWAYIYVFLIRPLL